MPEPLPVPLPVPLLVPLPATGTCPPGSSSCPPSHPSSPHTSPLPSAPSRPSRVCPMPRLPCGLRPPCPRVPLRCPSSCLPLSPSLPPPPVPLRLLHPSPPLPALHIQLLRCVHPSVETCICLSALFRSFLIYLAFIHGVGLVCPLRAACCRRCLSAPCPSVRTLAEPSIPSVPAISVLRSHRAYTSPNPSGVAFQRFIQAAAVPANFAHLALTAALCKLAVSCLSAHLSFPSSLFHSLHFSPSLSSRGIYISFVHKINLFLACMLPTHLLYLPSHLPKAYTFTVSMGSVALYICLLYSHTKFMGTHNFIQHK